MRRFCRTVWDDAERFPISVADIGRVTGPPLVVGLHGTTPRRRGLGSGCVMAHRRTGHLRGHRGAVPAS